jgi:hypothetical protein
MAVRVLLVLAGLTTFAVLAPLGCAQASSSVEKQEKQAGLEHTGTTEASRTTPEATTQSGASSEGGVAVGEAIAEADLKPVGDSGVSGTATFKEVGSLGVQVELAISGLPTKDRDATYYAQVHEGSCSDERKGHEHEEEHGAEGGGPALALVRLERLLAKIPGLEAHGGHEPGIPEVPRGSIEQPISFGVSAGGTISVTSLLEDVEPKRLTSGAPEYIHLHAAGSEDEPEELSCGDLAEESGRGSG